MVRYCRQFNVLKALSCKIGDSHVFSYSGIKVSEGFLIISNLAITTRIIYCYTCGNCKVTYYVKTFRHFYTRAAEHMGISNLTGQRLKNVKQSAISDHLLKCNCAINFDDFSILATDCNKFKLLLRESLLIKRDKPILNRTIKSFPLELFD